MARTLPDVSNPGVDNTELLFFKALHTPQWPAPSSGMCAGNFGQISGQAVGRSQIQMALKLLW